MDEKCFGVVCTSIPVNEAGPKHIIWWKYVARLYIINASQQMASIGFYTMKSLFPNNVTRPAETLEEFRSIIHGQNQKIPAFTHVHVHNLNVDEV